MGGRSQYSQDRRKIAAKGARGLDGDSKSIHYVNSSTDVSLAGIKKDQWSKEVSKTTTGSITLACGKGFSGSCKVKTLFSRSLSYHTLERLSSPVGRSG